MHKISYFFLSLIIVVLAGCEAQPPEPTVHDAQKQTFHYQLQNATFEQLKNLSPDYLVVDPDDAKLTQQQIVTLRNKGTVVLSYLSIGEAESYRDYWKKDWTVGNPVIIDEENPDWPGNYKVQYWHPGWQAIILDRVRKLTTKGYSGVYLDIIDAYEFYEDQGRESAAQDMIDFVETIANEGRSINKRFLIVPQNSPELYAFESYKRIIDGFGIEDIWFDGDRKQQEDVTSEKVQYLTEARDHGKFILSVDYPTKKKKVCEYYTRCISQDFACTVLHRELNKHSPLACDK